MPTSSGRPASVDDYIEAAPEASRDHLREIRAILRDSAPGAVETLKWGAPVLEEKRILFSYSAHRAHLSFTPTGPSLEPFREDLAGFKTGKDSVQFAYDKPLPTALIQKIAAYRVREVRENDARWMY